MSEDPLRRWQEELEQCLQWTHQSRLSKMLRSPLRTLYLHGLSLAAERLDLGLRRRIRTFWGGEMTVVLPDGISRFLFCNRFFEESSTRWLLQHLKPGQVFFDVGAHFGYFTLLSSSIVGASGSVHAFEPTPGTCRILRENTTRRDNIAVREAALWKQDCQLPFQDFGLRFSGLNSFTSPRISDSVRLSGKKQPEDRQRSILVRAIRGDDYVEQLGVVPSLVKIDVEGAELAVLEGMTTTLRRSRPLLIIEVEDGASADRASSSQVTHYLSELGYRIVPDRERDRGFTESRSSRNILFAPALPAKKGGPAVHNSR